MSEGQFWDCGAQESIGTYSTASECGCACKSLYPSEMFFEFGRDGTTKAGQCNCEKGKTCTAIGVGNSDVDAYRIYQPESGVSVKVYNNQNLALFSVLDRSSMCSIRNVDQTTFLLQRTFFCCNRLSNW